MSDQIPITVQVNGKRIERSHPSGPAGVASGFLYNAAANAISLINASNKKGTDITVSYERFSDSH
jgi:hypothetical protein